ERLQTRDVCRLCGLLQQRHSVGWPAEVRETARTGQIRLRGQQARIQSQKLVELSHSVLAAAKIGQRAAKQERGRRAGLGGSGSLQGLQRVHRLTSCQQALTESQLSFEGDVSRR